MFPLGNKGLRIGILGMTEGNGHPYSWSAMFNNYRKDEMETCGFPVIPRYLEKQAPETFGIPGAWITCVCCTGYAGREEAEHIARAAQIPTVYDHPEEMIGNVDAVIVATDVGDEHVERCRPFVEAGIPMFIDKPLVNKEEDLQTFVRWRKEGAKFISSSSLRYCKEIEPYYKNHYELGKLMYICSPMAKYYETYGIHALERMYPLLGPGFVSVQNTGTKEKTVVHIKHESGCDVHIVQAPGLNTCGMMVLGDKGSLQMRSGDSYYCFKRQLDLFVHWLRTGEEPFPFEETVELMKLVIGGIRSREEAGRIVMLDEIKAE
ncbi:MAG: Gfo/Idh/MocA family oxidoreductase [Oscillospiraceae bacterium]|nr:Gfo/Idh/MocA family oxidoreductase [Oscillospiraceae bacterium]